MTEACLTGRKRVSSVSTERLRMLGVKIEAFANTGRLDIYKPSVSKH